MFMFVFSYSLNGAVSVQALSSEKMKLHLSVLGHKEQLADAVETIVTDLTCAQEKHNGFAVSVDWLDTLPKKHYITTKAQEHVPLVVFLTHDQKHNSFEWRLYTSALGTMKTSKRILSQDAGMQTLAHHTAQSLWQTLTGRPGMFMTKLSYCKRVDRKKENDYSLLVGSPFVRGTTHDAQVVSSGALMAPRWNNSVEHPLILYSQVTPENVRLISTTLTGKKALVSNFEGLNMLPSFSADGSRVVYCLSRDGSSQLYSYELDPQTGKGQLFRLTHNSGNNVSPLLLDNGDIVFCSDYQRKSPQICYYHHGTKEIERITDGGYCSTPAYCKKTNTIAYAKLTNGVMQLWVYDCAHKQHKQLTFDQGDKEECSWSPCGTYLAYSVETKQTSRIAVKNCVTGEQFYKTSVNDYCVFPCWSPEFHQELFT